MENFADQLWQLPPPFNMIVLVVAIVFGSSLVSTFAKEVRKSFCHQRDAELKRDLVDQGLSVDEVERIVGAGPMPKRSKR